MQKEKKRKIIRCVFFCGLIFVICYLFFRKYYFDRHFFYNKSHTKCFTVWRKNGGDIYLIPRRYIGLGLPKDNYIKAPYTNTFFVVWDCPKNFYATIYFYNDSNTTININNDSKLLFIDRGIKENNTKFIRDFYYNPNNFENKGTFDSLDIFIIDFNP